MASRGRPPLAPGTYGEIWVSDNGQPYLARARFRDKDGTVRRVTRYGQTKTAAKDALRKALAERDVSAGNLAPETRVAQLAQLWLEEVDASDRAVQTKRHYRYVVTRYVDTELGQLRLSEASTRVCDEALTRISVKNGPSAARSARAVLNGLFRLAVRHGALLVSPVRETSSISVPKRLPRALTVTEVEELTDLLRIDPRAKAFDLADLVDFMLCTGVRIGEAAAVPLLDDMTSVSINATVIRIKGLGLVIQERPKSSAGKRVLPLPSFAQTMVEDRRNRLRFEAGDVTYLAENGKMRTVQDAQILFPAPVARSLRDPSNTAADMREVFDRTGCPACGGYGWHPKLKTPKQQQRPPAPCTDDQGIRWHELCDGEPPFAWLHSHVFRKTTATRLEAAGFTGREVADFLGHSQPSMTMNVYFGRQVVRPEMATALDR